MIFRACDCDVTSHASSKSCSIILSNSVVSDKRHVYLAFLPLPLYNIILTLRLSQTASISSNLHCNWYYFSAVRAICSTFGACSVILSCANCSKVSDASFLGSTNRAAFMLFQWSSLRCWHRSALMIGRLSLTLPTLVANLLPSSFSGRMLDKCFIYELMLVVCSLTISTGTSPNFKPSHCFSVFSQSFHKFHSLILLSISTLTLS